MGNDCRDRQWVQSVTSRPYGDFFSPQHNGCDLKCECDEKPTQIADVLHH